MNNTLMQRNNTYKLFLHRNSIILGHNIIKQGLPEYCFIKQKARFKEHNNLIKHRRLKRILEIYPGTRFAFSKSKLNTPLN